MEKEKLVNELLEIAKNGLSDVEYKYIKQLVDKERYNEARVYLECCVESAQRKLLDSIYVDKFDVVYASRYRTVKRLDNKITYICQELE